MTAKTAAQLLAAADLADSVLDGVLNADVLDTDELDRALTALRAARLKAYAEQKES